MKIQLTADANPSHMLHIINDPAGKKLVEKLFEEYIQQDSQDYTRYPEFLIAQDRLISEFGGRCARSDEEKDATKESKKKGIDDEDADSDNLVDQDYDDDQDIHDTKADYASIREINFLKRAITKALED